MPCDTPLAERSNDSNIAKVAADVPNSKQPDRKRYRKTSCAIQKHNGILAKHDLTCKRFNERAFRLQRPHSTEKQIRSSLHTQTAAPRPCGEEEGNCRTSPNPKSKPRIWKIGRFRIRIRYQILRY